MTILKMILLLFLVVCALAAALNRNLLVTVIIFMAYSLIMSIIWVLLQSPDLAITEAAVGAGITSILFFITLRKINLIQQEEDKNEKKQSKKQD
jgi:energy-converting hydrogenase B subunit D